MEIVKFVYLNYEIDFDLSKQEIMVNATEMAKVFGKQVESFTRNESTQNFIKECLKNENSRFLSVENESDLIDSKQKSGTWMHRILALKFTAWLDPAFELWIYVTIDKLINQYFKEQREALVERLTAKQKKALKKEEIITKYSDIPEIKEYFALEDLEKDAKKKQMAAVRDQVKQLQFGF